jgi:hypothetical protein
VTELGPIDATMRHESGEEFHVEVFLCDKCKHLVRMLGPEGKELPLENSAMCIEGCQGCECDRRS